MNRNARRGKSSQFKSTVRSSAFRLEALEDRRLMATGPALGTVSLINAATDAVIKSFSTGTAIDLSGGKTYSVAATGAAGATIGSIAFSVDGAVVRTENFAPYSIAGDTAKTTGGTDYAPWNVPIGSHTLTVTAYSLKDRGGDAGTPVTASFTASGATTSFGVSGLTLINAATNADIKPLVNATTLDMSAGKQYSIRANVTGATKSVVFKLDGATIRTESSAPFSIAGDNPITGGGTDYLPLTGLTNGTHTLVVSGFDAAGGTGNAGSAVTVTFTVTGVVAPTFGVTGLTLVNAATDADIGPVTNGMTIDFSGGKTYSIRANVAGTTTKSVVFKVDGATFRTENSAPYSIAGDSAKTGGGTDYAAWGAQNGSRTLVVSGFDATAGGGNAGGSVTVTVNVTGAPNTAFFSGTNVNGATGSTASPGAGSWIVKGSGFGITGVKDQFHFGQQARSGNFDFKTKLTSLTGGAAGIAIRTGTGGANSEVSLQFADGGLYLGQRLTFGAQFTIAKVGTGVAGKVWLRLKRVGTSITAFFGTDGVTWTTAGTVNLASLATTGNLGFTVAGGTSQVSARFDQTQG
jgi:hypothetical protein